MEKKFFIITGIVLTILLIVNLILFGKDGHDVLFYLGLGQLDHHFELVFCQSDLVQIAALIYNFIIVKVVCQFIGQAHNPWHPIPGRAEFRVMMI